MVGRKERRPAPILDVKASHIENDERGIACVVTFVYKQKTLTFRFEVESWSRGNLRLRRNDGGKMIDNGGLAGLVRDYAKEQILQYARERFSKPE